MADFVSFIKNLPLKLSENSLLARRIKPAAEHSRTNGKLSPGIRSHTSKKQQQAFSKQVAANNSLERLPDANEVVHFVLSGDYDLCNIIPRIIELAGSPCERLDLATLGFGDSAIEILCRLSDAGQVRRIRLLCSQYFKSMDTTLWKRAHRELTSRGHQLFIARNHAKLQLYQFAGGQTITLMSSANLRSCNAAESAVIFGDADVLNFWVGVVTELIQKAKKCQKVKAGRNR